MLTEIESGNKLIAEFMEYDMNSVIKYSKLWFKKMHYHSSWDWLMPVVQKIKGLEKDWPILTAPVLENSICAQIDSAYTDVVVFIKFYNEISATKK